MSAVPHFCLFIDGISGEGVGKKSAQISCPATVEAVPTVAQAGEEDVNRAVKAAVRFRYRSSVIHFVQQLQIGHPVD